MLGRAIGFILTVSCIVMCLLTSIRTLLGDNSFFSVLLQYFAYLCCFSYIFFRFSLGTAAGTYVILITAECVIRTPCRMFLGLPL